MLIGYARTSTTDQQAGFDAQLVELETYGCEHIFKEQVSAVSTVAQRSGATTLHARSSQPNTCR